MPGTIEFNNTVPDAALELPAIAAVPARSRQAAGILDADKARISLGHNLQPDLHAFVFLNHNAEEFPLVDIVGIGGFGIGVGEFPAALGFCEVRSEQRNRKCKEETL